MDISKASNLERLLFDLLGRDAATLKSTMETFESTGEVDLTAHLSTLKSLGFYSGDTNHQDRIDNIRWAYDEAKRMIDPHTASAVHVAREMGSEGRPMLCMETAKPCKFEDSIQEALDMPAPRPAGMEDLESREQRFFDVDANALSVQNFISEALSSRP